jgi:hypothetical protein
MDSFTFFYEYYFNIFRRLCLGLLSGNLYLRFHTKSLYTFHTVLIPATYPAYLNLSEFIVVMKIDEQNYEIHPLLNLSYKVLAAFLIHPR